MAENRKDNASMKGRHERGLFLVFFALMVVALLAVMALTTEVGRLLLASRQLQNAADAAALAGVQMLQQCNGHYDPTTGHDHPSGDPRSVPLDNECPEDGVGGWESKPYSGPQTQFGGWQAVKPAVLAVLAETKILGVCMGPVENLRLTEKNSLCDLGDDYESTYSDRYGGLAFMRGSNGAGLTFTIRRQFECKENSDPGSSVHVKDLDMNPDNVVPPLPTPEFNNLYNPELSESADDDTNFPYCIANRVRVDLSYDGVQLNLLGVLQMIGVAGPFTLKRTGAATIQEPVCGGRPVCSFYDDPGSTNCFKPKTVGACKTPAIGPSFTPTPVATATPA